MSRVEGIGDSSDEDGGSSQAATLCLSPHHSVDHNLTALRSSLRLVERRVQQVTEEEEDELREVHERFLEVVEMEAEEKRKRRLREMVDAANCLRDQILYVRRLSAMQRPAAAYFSQLLRTLENIIQRTFDSDFRQAAISVGVVEAAAELLVGECRVWGPAASLSDAHQNTLSRKNERRELRKHIASVLTNLTFGHMETKRFLCEYSGFLSSVVALLEEATNLVQPYSNLLRNMSWQAEAGMAALLSTLTRPLAKAAVLAAHRNEERAVKSALAALWNIIPYSEENMKAVCTEDGCLQMLAALLSADVCRAPVVVEYATGILKYACKFLVSGENLCSPHYMSLRVHLSQCLFPLLRAGALSIVKNALGALNLLFTHDAANLGQYVTEAWLAELRLLSSSHVDELRRPVRSILSRLNQQSSLCRSLYEGRHQTEMPVYSSGRLLPRRVGRSEQQPPLPSEHRSLSLPRPFTQPPPSFASPHSRWEGYGTSEGLMTASSHAEVPMQQRLQTHYAVSPLPFLSQRFPATSHVESSPAVGLSRREEDGEKGEGGEGMQGERDCDASSVAGSRASSVMSLSSMARQLSGLHSVIESADNSGRLSPVSYSDLPDSPTQFAYQQLCLQQMARESELGGGGGGTESASSSSKTASEHTRSDTPRVLSREHTPTFGRRVEGEAAAATSFLQPLSITASFSPCRQDSVPVADEEEEEDDYGTLDGGGSELLSRSIEEALPPKRRLPSAGESGDLLSSAIQSVLPAPPPFSSLPKNVRAECVPEWTLTRGPAPSSTPLPLPLMLSSPRRERVRDAAQLRCSEQDGSHSDDSQESDFTERESIVGVLPCDVQAEAEAEGITIDCSRFLSPRSCGRPSGVARLNNGGGVSSPRRSSALPSPRPVAPRGRIPPPSSSFSSSPRLPPQQPLRRTSRSPRGGAECHSPAPATPKSLTPSKRPNAVLVPPYNYTHSPQKAPSEASAASSRVSAEGDEKERGRGPKPNHLLVTTV